MICRMFFFCVFAVFSVFSVLFLFLFFLGIMEDALGDVVGSEEELARVVRLIEAAPTIKDAKLMLDNFDIIRHRHYLGVPGWRGCKRKRTHDDVRSIFVPVLLRNGAKVAMKSWKCQDHDNCRKAGFVIRDWYLYMVYSEWLVW